MKYKELQKGKKYWITYEDCCVAGSFQGTFRNFGVRHYEDNGYYTTFQNEPPDEDDDFEINFDTGYVEHRWGQTKFTEVPVE